MNNTKKALRWWNAHSNTEKMGLIIDNPYIFGYTTSVNVGQVTEKEMELMWIKEIGKLEAKRETKITKNELFSVFVAGFNEGINSGPFPKEGMLELFEKWYKQQSFRFE